jgi:hypothetical protein
MTTSIINGSHDIDEKAGTLNRHLVIRSYTNTSLGLNHDIIGGIPANRFNPRFKNLPKVSNDLRENDIALETSS